MSTIPEPPTTIDVGTRRSHLSPAWVPRAGGIFDRYDLCVTINLGPTAAGESVQIHAYETEWLDALEEAARTARARLTMWHSDHPDGGDEGE